MGGGSYFGLPALRGGWRAQGSPGEGWDGWIGIQEAVAVTICVCLRLPSGEMRLEIRELPVVVVH